MKKKKNIRFTLFLSLFLVSLVTCSQITQETINLQQDETYILKLEDYYDFTASLIDFPQGQLAENTKKPYQEIGEQTEGPIISSISSYQESLNSKYFIGYSKENIQGSCYDAQIIYFHLEVIKGVLTRTVLASLTLFSTCDRNVIISASFYSSTTGFISYYYGRYSLTFHFSYAQDRGLAFIQLDDTLQIDKQVAVQGSGNTYIIYVNKENVGLLKYKTGENTLENIDSYKINFQLSLNIVVDPAYTLFGFDQMLRILYSFFIDYSKDKLIINQQFLPQLSLIYNLKSIQRYKDILILTLKFQGYIAIVKLKNQTYIEEGVFQIDEVTQIPVQIDNQPIFIDYNIIVFYNNYYFQIFNIQKQQVIFQQTLDQNHIVDINQYIDNQFIVHLTKNNDQGKAVTINYTAQLQNPSLVITGSNIKLEFTIYQIERSYRSNIQIVINVTNDLKTTLTQNQINIQNMVPSLTDDIYSIPVEKYIIGSNFNPQISLGEKNFIRNIKLNRIIQLQQSASVEIKNIQNIYQTDGLVSSIITSNSGNNYSIFAAVPEIQENNGQFGGVYLYSTSFNPSSPIGIIDNYGSFILQSDIGTTSFTIYVPFMIRKTQLFYNIIKTACSYTNFTFASDTLNNVLFIMCGQLIEQFNYQFNQDTLGQLLISSQKQLIFDSSQYQKLICIQGNLFIYNDLSIAAYDYFANSLVGNPIKIPQLQTNQKIIIFSQSFIISYYIQEKLTISLYSYGQFQSGKAVFVRNLIQGQPSQTNLSMIPKRNNIEYLYVPDSVQNEYSLIRINNAYSQNQLYTTVTIASDKYNVPIISQDLICIIGSSQQVQCQQILKEATLSYQLNLNQNNFNNNLAFNSLVTLHFGDQKQLYEIQILRNGSLYYSTVNQSAESLQKLKTEVQDTDFSKGNIFYFNDQKLTNNCILGWDTFYHQTSIINRLVIEQQNNSNTIFTIVYNQKAVLEQEQIIIGKNLLKIDREASQICGAILDDSGSRIQVDAQSFNENIYLICEERLYKYQIQFTYDNSGSISQAVLLDQSFLSFANRINSKQFKRIVSFQTELWLFKPISDQKYQIVKIDDSDKFKIQKIEFPSSISINIINSLNLNLQFFRSGLINVENVAEKDKNIQYSYYNLKQLLKRFNFIVGENDHILLINQYSDLKFRVQFVDSFIYDITFSLDNNNQFIIESASSYYYKDAFLSLDVGISSDKYTLIVGFTLYEFQATLYNNQNGMQNQYLIQSSQFINRNDQQDQFYVTYAEQISQNIFIFYFSKGGSARIVISDSVGLMFMENKDYFKYSKLIIYPKGIKDTNQWINLSMTPDIPPPSPPSSSSQIIIIFSLSLFIILSLLLI